MLDINCSTVCVRWYVFQLGIFIYGLCIILLQAFTMLLAVLIQSVINDLVKQLLSRKFTEMQEKNYAPHSNIIDMSWCELRFCVGLSMRYNISPPPPKKKKKKKKKKPWHENVRHQRYSSYGIDPVIQGFRFQHQEGYWLCGRVTRAQYNQFLVNTTGPFY